MRRLPFHEVFWFCVGLNATIAGCSPNGASASKPNGDPLTIVQTVQVAEQGTVADEPKRAAQTQPRNADGAIAGPAAAPAPSRRPATSSEARQLIDLRTLPRLNATQVLDESATYLYYSATSSVAAASGFYLSELESHGWKQVPCNMPDNPQYRDLLFARDGFYLRLTVGASGDEGVVGISLANLGDIDLSNLPRLDNAAPHAASTPVNINYETPQGMPEAVKFCRQQLTRLGWHEYGDLYTDPPEVPHVKQLNFCQNANRLMVSIIRNPQLPNHDKTMIAYMAHHMLPYDVAVMPGSREVKLDSIRGRAEYVTSASVDELIQHYRQMQSQLGWTARPDADQIRKDGASIYVADEGELGFGIELSRTGNQTRVAMQRLSFAQDDEQAEGPQPTVDAVVADDTQAADAPTAVDEAVNDLQQEIEATVNKQLKAVEDQLKGLDADIDFAIPANILSDENSDEEEADEDASDDATPALDALVEDADVNAEQTAGRQAADESLAKLEELATTCTILYGDTRYALSHVLALRNPDDGTPVVIFCERPLNVGRAQRSLAKGESVSVLDLTGNDFPPSLEIRLQQDYISISCFVAGASINRGSTDFQADYLAGSRRVRGSVLMAEADEVFDKPFRFEATFDQQFLDGARAAASDNSLEQIAADSNYELPVPEGCQQVSRQSSPYRTSITAQTEVPMADLTTFYRRELSGRAYREATAEASPDGSATTLTFTSNEGPLTVVLRQAGDATQIELLQRNQVKAKRDKLLPAPGQGLLLLANAGDADVEVTFNRRTFKLPVGTGAQNPADAMKIPVLPGKHRVSIAAGGKTKQEVVTIDAGSTWGLIALPGGGSLAQILY